VLDEDQRAALAPEGVHLEDVSVAWTAGEVRTDPAAVIQALTDHIASLERRMREAGFPRGGGERGSITSTRAVVPTPSGKSLVGQLKGLFRSLLSDSR
jgi:hypothetical protein